MRKLLYKFGLMMMVIILTNCSNNSDDEVIEFENPMEIVGQQHNQGVKIILSNFGDIPKTLPEIKQKTEQLFRTNGELQAIYNVDFSNLDFVYDFPEVNSDGKMEIEKWVNEMVISEQFKVAILETFMILETSNTLDEIIKMIEEKEKNARSRFNGGELDTYYAHLAVAKYSATFWSPESEGGENGIKYIIINDGQTHSVNWDYVYRMDCAGTLFGGPHIAATWSAVTLLEELNK